MSRDWPRLHFPPTTLRLHRIQQGSFFTPTANTYRHWRMVQRYLRSNQPSGLHLQRWLCEVQKARSHIETFWTDLLEHASTFGIRKQQARTHARLLQGSVSPTQNIDFQQKCGCQFCTSSLSLQGCSWVRNRRWWMHKKLNLCRTQIWAKNGSSTGYGRVEREQDWKDRATLILPSPLISGGSFLSVHDGLSDLRVRASPSIPSYRWSKMHHSCPD